MELFICFFLATILTGGRVFADTVHAVKGTTPAHVEKARLRAQTRSGRAPKGRSVYADGKPRFGDVAAVYWGDAMQDAIDWHNRRRQEKAGERPAPTKPWWRSLWQLIWEPVGEKKPHIDDDPKPAPTPPAEPAATPPTEGDRPVSQADSSEAALNELTGPTGDSHVGGTDIPLANGPTSSTGGIMTAPAATEVNNNEDARIALGAMASAAAEAAEALAALEAAKAKLAAAVNGTLEGMSGMRFDSGATQAAAEAADAINVGDLAEWSEKFDIVEQSAKRALRALAKYLDAEDLVSSNRVDAATLQTH